MLRTIVYFHVNIIRLFYNICASKCTCLHKTVNIVVFFVESNENTYPKSESTHANVQSCPYNEKRLYIAGF